MGRLCVEKAVKAAREKGRCGILGDNVRLKASGAERKRCSKVGSVVGGDVLEELCQVLC